MKIAFIGAPGSGKSTLTSDVYTALKQNGSNVEIIPEWVRYDIFKNGPMKSIWEQYRTYQHQKEIEDAVPKQVETTIIDSSTLSPYFYASLYADLSDPRQRLVLQDMYRYLLDDLLLNRYDLIFLLTPIPDTNTDDGTRFQSDTELQLLADHMDMIFVRLFKVKSVHKITGPFETRLKNVLNIIENNTFNIDAITTNKA